MKTTPSIQILSLAFVLSMTAACGQKKSITITETVYVAENQAQVFDLLRSFEKFPEWSPFLVTDPQQKNHVTGTDGQIGSAFHWEGVAEKSKGQQILTTAEENTFLEMACEMMEPYEVSASFTYHLEAKEQGTVVTQVFEVPCSGFEKFMMSLFGVKKEMTETNQLGLQRLKAFAENN
ncbi:MAG: SRPBCC family protein [Bacteroidota bacterium]